MGSAVFVGVAQAEFGGGQGMGEGGYNVLVGLGNTLRRDDGVGVFVVRAVGEKLRGRQAAEWRVFEAGSDLMGTLHAIAGAQRAVIVDCCLFGGQPGDLRRFTPDQVGRGCVTGRRTSHGEDILGVLALSRLLGEHPQSVVLYGIQPADTDYGEGLSAVLAGRTDEYVRRVLAAMRFGASEAEQDDDGEEWGARGDAVPGHRQRGSGGGATA